MADPKHEQVLWKGVKTWNWWRQRNPNILPDLSDVDLAFRNLEGANFYQTNLRSAYMLDSNLERADLREANLQGTDLKKVSLKGARLAGVQLSEAMFGGTRLESVDLSECRDIAQVDHREPSEIGTETLKISRGKIPEAFLRGCGLSDWEIVASKLYNPSLSESEVTDISYEIFRLRTKTPIQIAPLFISYSHADTPFVETLEAHFDRRGIRYWRDVHNLLAGRIETQIDRAIKLNPTVLLVLSQNSVTSDWVEWEAAKARELERGIGRDVLCPVALDNAWKDCDWPGHLRRQIEDYYILDLSRWEDAGFLGTQFEKLMQGLGLFYGTAPGGAQPGPCTRTAVRR